VTTTIPDEPTMAQVRRARTLRRVGATALVVFVLAGAVGLFGTRTSSAAAEAGGWSMEVTYPSTSRPGHAVRFVVHLHHEGGFPDPIRVRMQSRYFDLLDENGFDPDPDSQTTDDRWTYYEYAPPDGDDFVIVSDTRIEPARQRGESGRVEVLDAQGGTVVSVGFRTRIWP
jgi:hypothetical protein